MSMIEPRYFTHQWTEDCCRYSIELGDTGKPLGGSAGSIFEVRGVRPRDFLYIVSHHLGVTYLIGRMRVKKLWDRKDFDAIYPNNDIWPSSEYAEGEWGTPIIFDRPIPIPLLKTLVFTNKRGQEKWLPIVDNHLKHHEAIRGVRRLTEASARDLDNLIAK
jgi:hypothetical protein